MTQTVSYERVGISLYLLQMANMPVASWNGVTNNHNQASNIRVCQPSVPSCLNISQITKIEQNKITLKTSFKKKKDVFSSSHETLPSPFWHSWSAPLLLVPLLSKGQWSWDTCKAHVIKKYSYLLSFTKLCPHHSPNWRPSGPHQAVRNCDVPQELSLNFCFVLCVTAHALLPLSLCLSPSLWRKSAGVTAKAAHTHSHADRFH